MMKNAWPYAQSTLLWLVSVALLGPGLLAGELGTAGNELASVLDGVPPETPADGQALCRRIAEAGRDRIASLADLLVDPNERPDDERDHKARYLLHGVAMYVAGPERRDHRQAFVDAVTAALAKDKPKPVKRYLLEQLQYSGGCTDETLKTVVPLLHDADLAAAAARTILMSAGEGDRVVALFRNALNGTKGRPRATIIQALGRLRDGASVPALLKDAASDNEAVRRAAVYALGNIGAPEAAEAIRNAVQRASGYEKREMRDNFFRYLRRLSDEGHPRKAADLCRQMMAEHPKDEAVQCAGLTALAGIGDSQTFADIMDALASENACIRHTARRLIGELPAGSVTTARIDRMLEDATADEHAEMLRLLAERDDPAGLPTARRALRHDDEAVRLAAIHAVGVLGGKDAVADLVPVLDKREPESPEYRAARSALTRMGDDETTAEVVRAMKTAEPGLKATLLEVLSGRNAEAYVDAIFAVAEDQEDEAVRVAVLNTLKEVVDAGSLPRLVELGVRATSEAERRAAERALAVTCKRIGQPAAYLGPIEKALRTAPAEARASLLRVLGVVGGDDALDVVVDATRNTNAEIRQAAVRVLAAWESPAAVEPLWQIVRDPGSEREQIMALRGYITLAATQEPPAKAVSALAKAMEAAERTDEQRMVLGKLASLGCGGALDLAAEHLVSEDVKAQAAMACRTIVPALNKAEARKRADLLKRFAAGDDEPLAKAAEQKLVAMKSDKYEAETADVDGGGIDSNHGGYSGDGFVNFDRDEGASIEWTLAAPEGAGRYVLGFRYALGGGNRPLRIAIDGNTVAERLNFPDTGGWSEWATVTLAVELGRGEHRITAETIGEEGPNVDYLQVSPKQE